MNGWTNARDYADQKRRSMMAMNGQPLDLNAAMGGDGVYDWMDSPASTSLGSLESSASLGSSASLAAGAPAPSGAISLGTMSDGKPRRFASATMQSRKQAQASRLARNQPYASRAREQQLREMSAMNARRYNAAMGRLRVPGAGRRSI